MPERLSALVAWWVAAAPGLVGPVYPWINAAHILSLGLLIGAVATLDLRLLGAFRATPVATLAAPLTRVGAGGLMFALLTGFLLFSVQPGHYLDNPAFLAKLVIVVFGVLNAALLRALPGWRRALAGGATPAEVRLGAVLSLAAWTSAVLAGRWIAFL